MNKAIIERKTDNNIPLVPGKLSSPSAALLSLLAAFGSVVSVVSVFGLAHFLVGISNTKSVLHLIILDY